jgi:hypothetical protein
MVMNSNKEKKKEGFAKQCHFSISSEMKISFGENVILLWVIAATFLSFACGTRCSEEHKRALLGIINSTNGVGFLDS